MEVVKTNSDILARVSNEINKKMENRKEFNTIIIGKMDAVELDIICNPEHFKDEDAWKKLIGGRLFGYKLLIVEDENRRLDLLAIAEK